MHNIYSEQVQSKWQYNDIFMVTAILLSPEFYTVFMDHLCFVMNMTLFHNICESFMLIKNTLTECEFLTYDIMHNNTVIFFKKKSLFVLWSLTKLIRESASVPVKCHPDHPSPF